jgi:hypothetical protein
MAATGWGLLQVFEEADGARQGLLSLQDMAMAVVSLIGHELPQEELVALLPAALASQLRLERCHPTPDGEALATGSVLAAS